MSLAYDQKTAIKLLYAGLGKPAQGPIPPSLEGYDSDFKNPYKQYMKDEHKGSIDITG